MTSGVGTFCLSRAVFDHPVVGVRGKFSRTEAWIWLLREAAYRPHSVGRGTSTIDLQRGQLAHSIRFMAQAWRWPRSNVHRFLECLKTGTLIGTEPGTAVVVITICKYDEYQLAPSEIGTEPGTPAGTKVGQTRIQKYNKKDSTSKNPQGWPDDAFAHWWVAVPRKIAKGSARVAFLKVQAKGALTFDQLLSATNRWARDSAGKETQFIPHPATWLNAERYSDEEALFAPAATAVLNPDRIAAARNVPADIWVQRVRTFADNPARWTDDLWGPSPGSAGCLAPPDTLAAYGYGARRATAA